MTKEKAIEILETMRELLLDGAFGTNLYELAKDYEEALATIKKLI